MITASIWMKFRFKFWFIITNPNASINPFLPKSTSPFSANFSPLLENATRSVKHKIIFEKIYLNWSEIFQIWKRFKNYCKFLIKNIKIKCRWRMRTKFRPRVLTFWRDPKTSLAKSEVVGQARSLSAALPIEVLLTETSFPDFCWIACNAFFPKNASLSLTFCFLFLDWMSDVKI